jgi:dihydroorotate dehydrogenase (NAD+) catalytic subunit
MKPDMRVQFAGIDLVNPILAASGTFGYGVEFEEIVSFRRIGGFVTKGISREPMAGNPAPRLIETAAGMINAIGLQNIGVERLIQDKLPRMKHYPGCAVIVNVFGYQIEDYVAVIERLNDAEGIAAYELNASCPNTRHGGLSFGSDPGILAELISQSKQKARRPVIVKLSPNVTSIAAIARAAQDAGADALSLINTFLSLLIDVETRRSRLANITGGLSGPAIKPIAVRMVWEAARAVTIPIIGLGGIATAEDAVEFLLAGATAVQIGTASYADPRATERIAQALEQWCSRHHVARVAELTGALDVSPLPGPALIPPPVPQESQQS